jgi:hypothetical protein
MERFSYFLLVSIVYLVYYLTLYPSVPGGDSGELLAEACVSELIALRFFISVSFLTLVSSAATRRGPSSRVPFIYSIKPCCHENSLSSKILFG